MEWGVIVDNCHNMMGFCLTRRLSPSNAEILIIASQRSDGFANDPHSSHQAKLKCF